MTPPTPILRIRDLVRTLATPLKPLPPLLLRVALGIVFIQSGWGKLHDLAGTTEHFVDWHIPMPHFNAVLASGTELFGGCLILVGLLTRFAAVPLLVTMVVAIVAAKLPDQESWTELFGYDELAYALVFLWLAVAGAGRLSLDRLLGKRLGLLVSDE
jgi:putative oxidoreductase